MLTSRTVEAAERPTSRRSTAGRPSKGRKGSSSRRVEPSSSRAADAAAKKKLLAAKRKAAKANKERSKARAGRRVAEKRLKQADKKAKASERRAKQEKRNQKKTTSGAGRSRASVKSSWGAFASRKSSRKGFDRSSSRRLRVLLLTTVLLLTAFGIGAVIYVNSSAFGVTTIEVSGEAKASAEEILEASTLSVGQNLMDVDPDDVAAEVAKVPWVAQVSVQRSWTGEIVISVSERAAVAALDSPSGYVLVDSQGRQLDRVASPPDSQIPVTGAEVSGSLGEQVSAAGLQATNFIESVSPKIRPLIGSIELANGRLVARLDVTQIEQQFAAAGPQIEANFGTNEKLDEKMVSLETLLARVDLTCAVRIDLSSPSKPTLLRTPAATNLEKLSTGPVDC